MILKDIALLASDTKRTQAYLQAMIRKNMLPAECIVYSDNCQLLQEQAQAYKPKSKTEKYFDPDCPILYSLEAAHIPYTFLENRDINSEPLIDAIRACKARYLIYSGYGAAILKSPLFHLGKHYIHIHAGLLPQYRGSTTFYYSYLQDHEVGATAIFLNEKIDEGEIIAQGSFHLPPEPVNIDYIYEPYIRSQILLEVLEQYAQHGEITSVAQSKKNAETYFIIHPVLKHIAMLEMEADNKKTD